jgi:predicted acyl esterase
MVPYHSHSDPQPLTPNEVYKFEISLEPMAYFIKQGHRLRLEIVNGDSPAIEILWSHYYRPDKMGSDTIHHDSAHPSELVLPVSSASA